MSKQSSRKNSKASDDPEGDARALERQGIAEEILADSARLPLGALAGFKEDDREEATPEGGKKKKKSGRSSVVDDVADALAPGARRGTGVDRVDESYQEAVHASNLDVDAFSNVNDLGKDTTGMAQEALSEKASKRGKSSRRSITEEKPKISKVKKSALREAQKEFTALSSGDTRGVSNTKQDGERCIVAMSGWIHPLRGGGERPIRMDTREGFAPKLNGLIQEIQRTRIHSHNREFNRVEKIRSLNKEIKGLKYQRAEYALDSANSQSDNWRWVNTNRARANPKEMLQDCAPAKRLSALRSIEGQCMTAIMEGTRPPSPARRPPTIRAWL